MRVPGNISNKLSKLGGSLGVKHSSLKVSIRQGIHKSMTVFLVIHQSDKPIHKLLIAGRN